MWIFSHSDQDKTIQTYGILSLYVALTFAIFAMDSVIFENEFQFIASIAASVILSLYVSYYVLFAFMRDAWKSFIFVVCIVNLSFLAIHIGMARFVYKSFGYRIYKKFGANAAMQEIWRTAQVYFSLLKFDLFMALLLMIMSYLFLSRWSDRSAINISALVFSILWSIVGFVAITKENVTLFYASCITSFLQPLYVAYKLVDLSLNTEFYTDEGHNFYQFLSVGIMYAFNRISLLWYMIQARRNFGKGLRNLVFVRHSVDETFEQSYIPLNSD